jgi:hypothetical protein
MVGSTSTKIVEDGMWRANREEKHGEERAILLLAGKVAIYPFNYVQQISNHGFCNYQFYRANICTHIYV